jgi:hypothetical protein
MTSTTRSELSAAHNPGPNGIGGGRVVYAHTLIISDYRLMFAPRAHSLPRISIHWCYKLERDGAMRGIWSGDSRGITRPYPGSCKWTSENSITTQYGAYCRRQQAQVQEGGSMPSQEDKRIPRNLECEKGHSLGSREIWQTVHYYPGTKQIVDIKTPKGAIDDVWCPVPGCGSRAKDPNA